MVALKRALSDYVDEVVAGGSPRTEALRRQLRTVQRHNARYFSLVVLMLAAMFVTGMGVVVSGASQQATIPVAAVLGISVLGMVKMMLALWREKVATELLIELSELDDGVLRQVVARLLERLR
jgi:hypothetical protein